MTNKKPVLLVAMAHPDDETFGMGGTLALYAKRGAEVHLLCATRGEVGEVADQYMQGYASIAELRESELRCASGVLGLTSVTFLGYRDSGMAGSPDNHHPNALAAAPMEEVAMKVAHYIRLLKPQVVVTFDPQGGYGHPDHIAIQRATVRAFDLAGEDVDLGEGLESYQAQKLYFSTFPHGAMKVMVKLMPLVGRDPRRLGQNKDIDLVEIAKTDFPITARIRYTEVAEQRDRASACHASQGGQQMTKGPLGRLRRLIGLQDTFMRAFPAPEKGKVERDLFAGLDIDWNAS
jgi:LmbE family N-acetylglucosaminyl deacetylase